MNEQINVQKKTIKLAKMGILCAISIVLVFLVHFPIFPAVPFLEYDPADISILIGTFAFGPLGGFLMTAVVSIIQGTTVSAASGVYGIIMHIIATGVFVLVAGLIYKFKKTKKQAILGLIIGSLCMVGAMYFANLIITPKFMNVPVPVVKQLMPFILGFNFTKAGINSVITILLYKHISPYLHSDSMKRKKSKKNG